jgi:hypothetical protein
MNITANKVHKFQKAGLGLAPYKLPQLAEVIEFPQVEGSAA